MEKFLELNDERFDIDDVDFTIDRSDIEIDMAMLPRRFIYYAHMEARFKLAVESKEAELKKLEADMDETIRASAEEKLTENKIKNKIIGSELYQDFMKNLLQLKYQHNLAQWIMRALSAKKDCLVAISYNDRQLLKMNS